MMTIIDRPTERTSALTDLMLVFVLTACFIALYRVEGSTDNPRILIWLALFGLLAAASLLGAIAHGFRMSPKANYRLWQPINLALGVVIALFVSAVVFDLWGEAAYLKVRLPMLAVAGIFYIITVVIPGTFLTFVAYEAVAMLFALAGYTYLAVQNLLPGAWWLVAGILLSIIAAGIQAGARKGQAIFWGLDNNGVFHLVQIAGVIVLTLGLVKSLE
jgi:hypothetical protein